MGYNVEKIFDDVAYLSKVHSKNEYDSHTEKFKEDRYGELASLTHADDVAAEAQLFCEEPYL